MDAFWAAFWAAVGGAVVGAIIGGLISWQVQMIALREARKQRQEDAEAKQKALGHALVFKITQIYSHLRVFNKHIAGSIESAKAEGFVGEPWQMVVPIVNLPELVHFTTDEMTLLLALKENTLFNDLADMDERHNGTVGAFEAYAEHRLELGRMLPSVLRGNVGRADLTDDQMKVIGPKMVEVRTLLAGLMQQCQLQEKDAQDALTRLLAALSAKIGLTLKLELKRDDGQWVR